MKAFVDNTGRLKAWGFMESNEPGDVVMNVPDSFDLAPGRWRWDGERWQPVPETPPPPPPDPLGADTRLGRLLRDMLKEMNTLRIALRLPPIEPEMFLRGSNANPG